MYSGNIFPLSNNNYRIGSSSNRFIDAYIQTWVYANSGLYMNPSGITQNGSYLELSSGGNEIIIAGGTDFYVNYRGASYGGRSVPKKMVLADRKRFILGKYGIWRLYPAWLDK